LTTKFPTVSGTYAMTDDWTIELPMTFKRRIEDGSLVLWRDGITAWIIVWKNDRREPIDVRVKSARDGASPEAYDFEEEESADVSRFAYRVDEESEDDRVPAFYCFAIAACGHVQMAVYFDDEKDTDVARVLWRGLRPVTRQTRLPA
jgi:hypothetical protein